MSFWEDKFLFVTFDENCDYAHIEDTMNLIKEAIEKNSSFMYIRKANLFKKVVIIDKNLTERVLYEKEDLQ